MGGEKATIVYVYVSDSWRSSREITVRIGQMSNDQHSTTGKVGYKISTIYEQIICYLKV